MGKHTLKNDKTPDPETTQTFEAVGYNPQDHDTPADERTWFEPYREARKR